jgi:hypothetical protein
VACCDSALAAVVFYSDRSDRCRADSGRADSGRADSDRADSCRAAIPLVSLFYGPHVEILLRVRCAHADQSLCCSTWCGTRGGHVQAARTVLLLDPMLATGGSAMKAVEVCR